MKLHNKSYLFTYDAPRCLVIEAQTTDKIFTAREKLLQLPAKRGDPGLLCMATKHALTSWKLAQEFHCTFELSQSQLAPFEILLLKLPKGSLLAPISRRVYKALLNTLLCPGHKRYIYFFPGWEEEGKKGEPV